MTAVQGYAYRGPMTSDNFTMLHNEVMRDATLSAKAKAVFGYLSTNIDGWGITEATVMKHMKEGRDAIRAALKELEARGYILRRRQIMPGGKFGPYVWFYTDIPAQLRQSGITDQGVIDQAVASAFDKWAKDKNVQVTPVTENPATDNPATENPTHKKTTPQKTTEEDHSLRLVDKVAEVAQGRRDTGQVLTEPPKLGAPEVPHRGPREDPHRGHEQETWEQETSEDRSRLRPADSVSGSDEALRVMNELTDDAPTKRNGAPHVQALLDEGWNPDTLSEVVRADPPPNLRSWNALVVTRLKILATKDLDKAGWLCGYLNTGWMGDPLDWTDTAWQHRNDEEEPWAA